MHICVLYTGGTLGMRVGPHGLAPAPGFLTEQLRARYPDVEVIEYQPLLDSSEMTPHDWNRIGQDISDRLDQADAFVVLHGTDTLAYTASALSFMLAGIDKAVLVTGAQHAWEADNSDAPRNVEAALLLAQSGSFSGVGVIFDGQLLQANRVRKADCEADAAFASPNQAPIALAFGQGWALPAASSVGPFNGYQPVNATARIVRLTVTPGFATEWIAEQLAHGQFDGVVLETLGSGNVPSHPALTTALRQLAATTLVVNCTQCWRGRVHMGQYAASQALLDAGVLDAGDMTPEAAVAKLYWIAGQALPLAARRELFLRDIAGEARRF